MMGGVATYWGPPPKRNDRTILRGTLTVASIGIGLMGAAASLTSFLPGLAGLTATPFLAASHLVERVRNGVESGDEVDHRAKVYSAQIFKTLGVVPRPGQVATVDLFKQAAAVNPELAKLYKAPLKKESDENRKSLLMNGGIVAASTLTGAGGALAGVAAAGSHAIEGIKIAGEAGKIVKGGMHVLAVLGRDGAALIAGEKLAHVLGNDKVDPHELVMAIEASLAEAQTKGIAMDEVLSPNLIFALRVAQDEQFSTHVEKTYGKVFHKLDGEKQAQVMLAYPALANAATSEASAVGQGILRVTELAASKPNLNSRANQYAMGAGRASSFASRIQAQRMATTQGIAPLGA